MMKTIAVPEQVIVDTVEFMKWSLADIDARNSELGKQPGVEDSPEVAKARHAHEYLTAVLSQLNTDRIIIGELTPDDNGQCVEYVPPYSTVITTTATRRGRLLSRNVEVHLRSV